MARITIEDCIEKVPNRFQLVQMAAIRAKQLKKGANPMLRSEENKAVVMSLREIAAGYVAPDYGVEAASPESLLESPEAAAPATDTPKGDATS
jgi:DNA-directed RNA polymerase subunit omega